MSSSGALGSRSCSWFGAALGSGGPWEFADETLSGVSHAAMCPHHPSQIVSCSRTEVAFLAMFDTVCFHSYKCLADVSIELGRMTLLVGANASGKSSVRGYHSHGASPCGGCRCRDGVGLELTSNFGKIQ